MTNGHIDLRPPQDANGVLDLSALINKERIEGKMARAKLVIFPLGNLHQMLTLDGTYTLKAEGMPVDAEMIGMMPVPNPGHIGLIYSHKDWPMRKNMIEWEIVTVTWKRYAVDTLGEELRPDGS